MSPTSATRTSTLGRRSVLFRTRPERTGVPCPVNLIRPVFWRKHIPQQRGSSPTSSRSSPMSHWTTGSTGVTVRRDHKTGVNLVPSVVLWTRQGSSHMFRWESPLDWPRSLEGRPVKDPEDQGSLCPSLYRHYEYKRPWHITLTEHSRRDDD